MAILTFFLCLLALFLPEWWHALTMCLVAICFVLVRNSTLSVALLISIIVFTVILIGRISEVFIGLILAVIYIGAIAVLFLFVVMTVDSQSISRAGDGSNDLPSLYSLQQFTVFAIFLAICIALSLYLDSLYRRWMFYFFFILTNTILCPTAVVDVFSDYHTDLFLTNVFILFFIGVIILFVTVAVLTVLIPKRKFQKEVA